MQHMVRHLVCLAAVAGLSFGAFAEGFSDDNIACADESVRAIPIGNRTVYVFTNTTAEAIGVTVKRDITIEKLLVVGGGGAGGNHFGGGGGGGGVVYEQYSPRFLTSADTVSVLVGTGGVGKADKNWRGKGGATTLTISGTAITAFGGGGGSNYDSANPSTGSDIGSAGGGDNQGAGKTYTASQGNAGGARGGTAGGGGGGGAAKPGENGGRRDEFHSSYTRGGNGGEGLKTNITGEDEVYGSGGGGGGRPGNYWARNGKGGTNAGDGVWASDGLKGLPALAGFGSGGGGGSTGGGGTGGSGTVILLVAVGDTTADGIGFALPENRFYKGTAVALDLVVTNNATGAVLDQGDYTVSYVGNDGPGTCVVTVTTASGAFCRHAFELWPSAYVDDVIRASDAAVRRVSVGKRFAYVFTGTAAEVHVEPIEEFTVEKYLLVGGGGAGGRHMGGGGGGGGVVYADTDFAQLGSSDSLSLSIGAGGVGVTGNETICGQPTTLTLPGRTAIKAYGGGGGGTYDTNQGPSAGKFGSGGGGAGGSGGKTDGTHYTSAQGNYGGTATGNRAGGGGGAGEPGADGASSGSSGNGGEGRVLSITGTPEVYGSGGGGGGGHQQYGGQPGLGGTNAGDGEKFGGGWDGKRPAVDGFGGGGGGGCTARGGNGGSGTVVLNIYPGDSTKLQFEIAPIEDQLWYGVPVVPTVTVRRVSDPSVVLTENTDYTLTIENNNAEGVCTVTATGIAGSDYEGLWAKTTFTVTRAYKFEIAKPADALLYDEPLTPKPAVTNSVLGEVPVEGTDFTYSYVGNDTPGTAKVIATGCADTPYFGWAATNTFEVLPTYSDDPNFIVSDPDFEVKTLGKRKVYVFTNAMVNTLRPKRTVTVEKMLVVGGGGAGGGHIAGGGGGGGFVYSEEAFLISAGQDFDVVVGAGGIAKAGAVGRQGGSSYLRFGDERLSEAYGGGGGGCEQNQPPQSVTDGHIGSAGGSAHSVTYVDGQHYNSAQGNRGGLSAGGRNTTGGGGAGDHGLDKGQEGGPGKVCGITGVEEVYGSGGGAGAGWGGYGLKTCGAGGEHAGNGAAYESYSGGTPGDPGFGGGGGGAARSAAGGNGGSGTVILYIAERDTLNYRYTVLPPPAQAWTGEEVRPEPVVSNIVSGAILRKGVDYTLAWTDCDRPGTGRVTALGVDGSDYDGASEFATFQILDGTVFEVLPIGTQYYFGEAVEPTLTVTNPVVGCLLDSSDYEVEFFDNDDVGTATAVVSGVPGSLYEDCQVSADFEIVRGYCDENVRVDDVSVRCVKNGDRLVYVLTNAMVSKMVPLKDLTLVDMLVVGGGGQGGGLLAGGGGGGGVISNSTKRILFAGDVITTAVGAGGRSTTSGDAQGVKGGESRLTIGDFSLLAFGGGGGGTCNQTTKGGVSIAAGTPTNDGRIGSGGGSTKGVNCQVDGVYYTASQGKSGGIGSGYLGGGGGGAGEAGKSSSGSTSGRGGEGITNSITGVAEVYGSGGGGGGGYGGSRNVGGTHGGAGALEGVSGTGSNGDDGFGAGGGGGGYTGTIRGGAGGNGTVILAFVVGGQAGQPELDENDVDFGFLGGYTIPRVSFALGGEPDAVYSATVTVSFGVGEETEPRMTRVFSDKVLGDEVALVGDFSPAIGSEVWCRIVIDSAGAETRTVELVRTATGKVAPFIGHGGGASVMHVWADAPGDGSGSDWLGAMTNFVDAVKAAVQANKSEIWIIGEVSTKLSCPSLSPDAAFAVRGGFTGVEDRADQREKGAMSTIDGGNVADNLLAFANAKPLELEGLNLVNARQHAVVKSGAGDLTVTNCNIEGNGLSVAQVSGRALNLSGTVAAQVTVVDTRFARNYESDRYGAYGPCVYLSTLARATFDNCLFVTNGVAPFAQSGVAGPGESACRGGAVYASNAPLTMRNCRLLANRANNRSSLASGGIVRLEGASHPSAFTNCLFVGNSGKEASANEKAADAGGVISVLLGSAAGRVDVDCCTFAYNLECAWRSPAAINAMKGTVNVRNSIFWGNARRAINQAGVDIDVKADGAVTADWCLFEDDTTNHISAVKGVTPELGEHNVYGKDPKFMTPPSFFDGMVLTNASTTLKHVYFDWNRLNELVRFNAHLRGGRHVDETTGTEVFAAGRSPAINAGDPAHGWSNEPAPNGRRVNMGFYGNTPWATMSPGGMMLLVK